MNTKRTFYNVLLWIGLYLLWILVFQKRAFAFSRTMTIQFCYLLFIAGNYYFNVYFNIPGFLYKKKYLAFGLLLIAGIMAGSLLRVPVATYLNQHYFSPGKPAPPFSELFLDSFANIFIWVICLVAAKLIFDRVRFQRYIDSIEKEKTKNELDFLKAQFNPHFLFNSINSIYGNIDKRNSEARQMLLTFSEMLRYQLYECNANLISLEKEITYIRNYVALQQTRNPENLAVTLDIEGKEKGVRIAPLLFIAFIENAFKYVSRYENRLNEIRISLCAGSERIVFKAFNTREKYNGRQADDHNGIGISNVRRRLELLYPRLHELTINDGDDFYEAILTLQT